MNYSNSTTDKTKASFTISNNELKNLVGINDPNLEITSFDSTHMDRRIHYVIDGKLDNFPSSCPACGGEATDHQIVRNGTYTAMKHLYPVTSGSLDLRVKVQRYYCKQCGHHFRAKTPIYAPNCTIANDVKRHILEKSLDTISVKRIATDCHVSWSTVQRHIHVCAKDCQPTIETPLPRHISIDEVRAVGQELNFICIDAKTHELFGFLPAKRQRVIETFFYRYTPKMRQQVESVVMDMNMSYYPLFKRLFPNAEIVFDRFHLVQSLKRAVNYERVDTMNQFKLPDPKLYRRYKHHRDLFVKPATTLDTIHFKKRYGFDYYESESGVVDALLATKGAECLKDTYDAAHDLYYDLNKEDFTQFKTDLYQLPQNYPKMSAYLKTVCRSWQRRLTDIKHSFDYKELSNGPIEGTNNRIKALKRSAYGYRNFINVRDRVLLLFRFKPQE